MKILFYLAFVLGILDGMACYVVHLLGRDEWISLALGPAFLVCFGAVIIFGIGENVRRFGGGHIVGVGEVSAKRRRALYKIVTIGSLCVGTALVGLGILLIAWK